jgi:hypothetical protein
MLSPLTKILYSDVLMTMHIDTTIFYTSSCEMVMSLSQENAADLHSLGKNPLTLMTTVSGFGGLVVSMLASGKDRGFEPGRNRPIFRVQ